MSDTSWQELGEKMGEPDLVAGPGTSDDGSQAITQLPPVAPELASVVPIQAPPARSRARAPAAQATPRASGYQFRKRSYFRNALDAFLPTAEGVKVWRRDEMGALVFLRRYTLNDLDQAHDAEDFVQRYLVPKWGPGEYDLALVNGNGEHTRMVPIVIAGDPTRPTGPDPLERLTAKLDALETQKAASNGTGMDYALLSAMRGELAALRSEMARATAPSPMPMFPPIEPAPQVDAGAIVEKALHAAQQLAQIHAQSQPRREDSFGLKDVLTHLPTVMMIVEKLTKPLQEGMEALAESVEEMRKVNEHRPGLKDQLEEFRALKEVARDLGFQGPESGDGSFAGFLRELVADFPEKIEAIGGLVDRIKSKEAQGSTSVGQRQLAASVPASPPPAQAVRQERSAADAPPAFPAGFEKAVKKIAKAKNDGDRIGATIAAFQVLAQSPTWRVWLDQGLLLAKEGKKEDLLKLFKELLEGLAAAPVFRDTFTAETAQATYAAFEKHADDVIATLAPFAK